MAFEVANFAAECIDMENRERKFAEKFLIAGLVRGSCRVNETPNLDVSCESNFVSSERRKCSPPTSLTWTKLGLYKLQVHALFFCQLNAM